jgi:KDO2-lipid IV(A) lauroyltransferase
VRHRIEYAAARTAFKILGTLPRGTALGLGAGLGQIAFSPFRVRVEVVEAQIAAAFPDRHQDWVHRTARECYRHFGREAAEIVRLEGSAGLDMLSRTSHLEDVQSEFQSRLVPGMGAVIVTGHLGNWEAAGAAVASLGMPLAAVVKRQSNQEFDRLLVDSRRRIGIEPVYMEDARARLEDLIRSGTSVALVADQDAGNRGLFVPFLGRPASTFRGPARLSLSTGAPLFFGAAIREGNGYRGILESVETGLIGNEAERELTRGWVQRLESWVRRVPNQYFWFHRRWKTRPRSSGSASTER